MYLVVKGKVTEFETSSSIFVAGRLKKPRGGRISSLTTSVNRVKLPVLTSIHFFIVVFIGKGSKDGQIYIQFGFGYL